MRNAFADEITKIASKNKDICLLAADIGNRLFDNFKEVNSGRFFNCGIAEANMLGAAAGMSMSGLRPFAYTIAPFLTSRAFEQIKIDLCYHNTNVVVVGTGAGLSYSELGGTHHTFEDIGILKTLPNMTIICPADAMELRMALRTIAAGYSGPVYLRIGKKNDPVVFHEEFEFVVGKAVQLSHGKDVCLISTGNMTHVALDVVKDIESQSQSKISHIHLNTIKPLDVDTLKKVFSDHSCVISLEEHSVIGGLGSSLADFKNAKDFGDVKLKVLGIRDEFLHEIGNQKWARKQFGLDFESVRAVVLQSLEDLLK